MSLYFAEPLHRIASESDQLVNKHAKQQIVTCRFLTVKTETMTWYFVKTTDTNTWSKLELFLLSSIKLLYVNSSSSWLPVALLPKVTYQLGNIPYEQKKILAQEGGFPLMKYKLTPLYAGFTVLKSQAERLKQKPMILVHN